MINNYDVFREAPGRVTERICRICGTVCTVERNRLAAASWVDSMAKRQTLHDYFECPNTGTDWHDRASELVQRIEEMPSKRVAALMRQDLDELLAKHGCKLEEIDGEQLT